MIVLVGLEPPEVVNTLPSAQNTLSIWCIRPFPSTTLVIGFAPICIPPMVCRPVGGAVPLREFAGLCATGAQSCAPDAPHIVESSGMKKRGEACSNFPIL